MNRTKRRYSDDDAFDERGILKDGRRAVFRTQMMDGANRIARVTGSAGLGRPGYRIPLSDSPLDALAAATKRQSAYDSYERALTNAWRGRGDAVGESDPSQIGAACTVYNEQFPDDFGAPGHLRMYGGKVVCVPDRRNDEDELDDDEPDDEEEQEEEEIADPTSDARRRRRRYQERDPAGREAGTITEEDGRTVKDHQRRMDRLYAARDAEVSNAWRRG